MEKADQNKCFLLLSLFILHVLQGDLQYPKECGQVITSDKLVKVRKDKNRPKYHCGTLIWRFKSGRDNFGLFQSQTSKPVFIRPWMVIIQHVSSTTS